MARLLPALLVAAALFGCGDKKSAPTKRDEADATASSEPGKRSEGQLTAMSRRLACEAVKGELAIDYYVTRDKLTEKPAAEVEALLKRYQSARYTPTGGSELTSKVKTRVVEVKTDSDKTIATAEGVQEQTFGEAQGPNSAVIMRGFHGFVVKYGNEKEVLPWWPLDDTGSLEFSLTSKIRDLTMRVEKERVRIGFVSQKDELGPDDSDLSPSDGFTLINILREYYPMYSIEPVDLKAGEVPIDPAFRGLIITQPGKPFTEKELRRVDEFVMRGDKGLLVAAGAANLARGDTTMTATLDRRGLEKLLGGYGFDLGNDVILDGAMNMQWQAQNGIGGAVTVKIPSLLVSTPVSPTDPERLDTSFVPFFRIRDLAFPFPSPIVLKPERQKSGKQRVLMRTSAQAVLDTRAVKSMLPTATPEMAGAGREHIIAASLEGEIATAFPDGDNMGIDVPAKSPRSSRIFVVASSQFFANPFVVAGRVTTPLGVGFEPTFVQIANAYAQSNVGSTLLVFKSSLEWLAGGEGFEELAATVKPVPRKDTTAPSAGSASLFDAFKR